MRISEGSDYTVTTSGQITGTFSEIMRIDPSAKQGGVWFGVKPNFLALMRFVQTDGTELLPGTELRMGIKPPNKNPRYFTSEGFRYEDWYYINQGEGWGSQQNEEFQGSLTVPFQERKGVAVRSKERLIIEAKAENQIDWAPDSKDSNLILEVDRGTGQPPIYS